MGEPLTPSGVFLRNGLLALGFDEASANERIVAIEDEARAAAPSPTQIAIEHVKNMDRPMEAHEVERLERWVDVPGYGRMPARLMDPFECICDIEDTLAHHPEKAETFAREIAALLDSGEQDGLDVERLARAIDNVSSGRPEYIVTGAEHATYWTNETVAKHLAAEYARLSGDKP